MRPSDLNPVRLFRGNNSNDPTAPQPQNSPDSETVRRGNLGNIQDGAAADDTQPRVDGPNVGRDMSAPTEGRAMGRLGKIAGLAAFGALNIGVYEGFRSGAIQNFFSQTLPNFFTGSAAEFFTESVPHFFTESVPNFFTETLKLGMEVGVNASPLGVVIVANVGFAALTKMSYSAFSNQLEKSSMIQKLKDKNFEFGQQITNRSLAGTGLNLQKLRKFNLVKGKNDQLVDLSRASLFTGAKAVIAGAAVVGALTGAGAFNGSVFGGGFGGGVGAMAGAMAGLALVGVKYGSHLQSELRSERSERVRLADRIDALERGGNRAVPQQESTEFDLALEELSPEQRQRYQNNIGGALEESDILPEDFTTREKVQFWANLPEDQAQALVDKKDQVSQLKAELNRIALGNGEGLAAKADEYKTANNELQALINESLNSVAARMNDRAAPVEDRGIESDSEFDTDELNSDLESESSDEVELEGDSDSDEIETESQKNEAANDSPEGNEAREVLNGYRELLPQKYQERFDLLDADEKMKFLSDVQNSPTLTFMLDLNARGAESIETEFYDDALDKVLPANDDRAAV